MKNDTNSSASIYLFSSSLPLFFKGKFMLSLPFFLIWVVVISWCSSTGIKDKSQLMLDEMLFCTYGVESLDAVTEEPMFEEATSDSYKLSNTPLREKLNILGEGIKKTVVVLVKSVKGAISGGTAGAVIGGA